MNVAVCIVAISGDCYDPATNVIITVKHTVAFQPQDCLIKGFDSDNQKVHIRLRETLTKANSKTLIRRETPAVAKSSSSLSNSMLQVGKEV